MKRIAQLINKALEYLIVAILSTMSCLVFLNVVLRYGFNSSIVVTEEVSRYLFVWLTFLGAVLAFSDNQHVAVGIFTQRLSRKNQQRLQLLTDGLMLFCCSLIISGSWVQFQLNLHNLSPISEIPTGITFFASFLSACLIALLLIARLCTNFYQQFKGVAQ